MKFMIYVSLVISLVFSLLNLQSCAMAQAGLEKATFAGGCFWCMEHPFDEIDGVKSVVSGYTGGQTKNPTYKEVAAGKTGHAEAVEISFNPAKVTYRDLVEHFWKQIDPTDSGGQFVDRGSQYRSAIFYHSEDQKRIAEESRQKLDASGRFKKPVITEITKAGVFYPAEDYHQDYYKKCPNPYKGYRSGSGRDQFLNKFWDEDELKLKKEDKKDKNQSSLDMKKKLTPLQYAVTQQCGTEPAFNNAYWDNKKEGIYVDIISGVPLFSSKDKFDSGSGWPSFTKPLADSEIKEVADKTYGMVRTEVKGKDSDLHLGHVFNDGPGPNGLRYCINSASLRFIAREDMVKEGYEQYLKLLE